jgi:diaminopimelate decarboxylase
MSFFALKNGVLHAESVALPAIAEQFGTPAYVYSRAALEVAARIPDVLGGHPAGKARWSAMPSRPIPTSPS